MKYSINTIVKAVIAGGVAFLGAAVAVAQGADLSTLSIVGWLSALGSALTAGTAVFIHPAKGDAATTATPATVGAEPVIATISDAISAANDFAAHLDSLAAGAKGQVTDIAGTAAEAIAQIQKAVGANPVVQGAEKAVGSLVSQVIASTKK
ncbi:MAG: hypothetical protein ACRDTI_20880 [Mycobacterium sp.]